MCTCSRCSASRSRRRRPRPCAASPLAGWAGTPGPPGGPSRPVHRGTRCLESRTLEREPGSCRTSTEDSQECSIRVSSCRLSVGLLIKNLRAPVESEPECRSACAIPNKRCWQQQSPSAAVPLSLVTASTGEWVQPTRSWSACYHFRSVRNACRRSSRRPYAPGPRDRARTSLTVRIVRSTAAARPGAGPRPCARWRSSRRRLRLGAAAHAGTQEHRHRETGREPDQCRSPARLYRPAHRPSTQTQGKSSGCHPTRHDLVTPQFVGAFATCRSRSRRGAAGAMNPTSRSCMMRRWLSRRL